MARPSGTGLAGIRGFAIFAILIGMLVSVLRRWLGGGRILRMSASATSLGHLMLLIVAGLFLLASLWIAIKHDSMQPFLIGVGVLVAMAVGQYVADTFIKAGRRLLQASPTAINNLVLLDVMGLVITLLGVGVLIAGAVQAIQMESMIPLITGFIASLLCVIAGSLAFCPEALNITHIRTATAGEEAIGLASFFLKAMLMLAPFFYLLGAIFSIVFLFAGFYFLVGRGSEYLQLADLRFSRAYGYISDAGVTMLVVSFYPLALYVIFLVYYLFIDVIRALLNIDRNVAGMHKRSD